MSADCGCQLWQSGCFKAALSNCCTDKRPQLDLKGQVAWEKLAVCWKAETSICYLFSYSSVCVCGCVQAFTKLQFLQHYWNTDRLLHSHCITQLRHAARFLCLQRWNLSILHAEVILTVPMRWPVLRAHTKVPVPCSMVLIQDWGALSWSLMVWLTSGI